MGPSHILVVTEDGCVFGWGKNDQKQVYDSRESFIQQPKLIRRFENVKIGGVSCGMAQSFVWSDCDVVGMKMRVPFVVDLCENTFRYAY